MTRFRSDPKLVRIYEQAALWASASPDPASRRIADEDTFDNLKKSLPRRIARVASKSRQAR